MEDIRSPFQCSINQQRKKKSLSRISNVCEWERGGREMLTMTNDVLRAANNVFLSGFEFWSSIDLSRWPFQLVLCRFLKIRNRESRFLLLFSERRNCESKKRIPFRLILRFFWPTIPKSIPEERPKTVKESELWFYWNWNRHSPRRDGDEEEADYHKQLARRTRIRLVASSSGKTWFLPLTPLSRKTFSNHFLPRTNERKTSLKS